MAENPDIRAQAEANRRAGGGSYDDKIRLGELVAAAVKAREADDAAQVVRAVEAQAAAVSEGPESTGWLVNASFLVDRDAAARFLETVDQARKDLPHLELRVNGPLPPYSFVEPGPAEPAGTAAGADAGAE
jgi:hypothetical protein